MTDPNQRRRRAYYSPPTTSDQTHPFLTPNGYRLQTQQPLNVAPPRQPMPIYPPAPVTTPKPNPIVKPRDDSNISLQNILPSKQFPHPEALDRQPLTSHCRTNLIANPMLSQLKAIGKLFIRTDQNADQDPAIGSAWVAGPSIIATSAHNVFDFSTQSWSSSLDFHPAYDYYSQQKLSVCRVTGCTVPKDYFNNPATNSDIAICYVDQNIGDILGETIRMEPINDNDLFDRESISIVGYPSGSAFDFGKQMWQSVGDYLFGRRNHPGDDYAPAIASRFGAGSSGCPWLIRDQHNEFVAIGATSGHARLRGNVGEPNLMSLTSPFFGARLFDKLAGESVFHEFAVSNS